MTITNKQEDKQHTHGPLFPHFGTAEEEEASEAMWEEFLVANRDMFVRMADKALAERRHGKTLPLSVILDEK